MNINRPITESFESWLNTVDTATMTDEEVWWQKHITSILLNKSGKWGVYQHALYAKRFQNFILKIVPLEVTEPEPFTACVVFEQNVIYVGEGFLIDDKKCYQLNVIIRHEMAHILLRHQIRMMHEIGELPYSRVRMSQSIQELINIIADFEISNRKYTSEDKKTIAHLYLNGKAITGLVTEMHREEWLKLSIEEMYHKLLEELKLISTDIKTYGLDSLTYTKTGKKLRDNDNITHAGVSALQYYTDTKTPSVIWTPIDEYFKKSKQFDQIAQSWRDIVLETYSTIKDYSKEKLEELLNKIAASGLVEPIEISKALTVFIPEEKFWVVQVIKNLLGNARPRPKVTIKKAEHSAEYKKAYNTIIGSCGHRSLCDNDQLNELIEIANTITPAEDNKDE